MTPETSAKEEPNPTKIDTVIQSINSGSLTELMAIWRALASEEGSGSPVIFRSLGERILAQGEPLLAYDVVTAGLALWPKDVRLRQLQGLALSRSGATERANAVLEQLLLESENDEETRGMLGRTYKDLAANASTLEQRREFLQRAAKIYGEAYHASGGYWTGINAAAMSLLIGEEKRARELAEKVRAQCLREVADPGGDQYWELAALGEAALVCRDWKEAEKWYTRAGTQGERRFGDLHSSRRNARLILQYWNQDKSWIDKYLQIPCVIVFAGHMIDRPGRAEPRFPHELQTAVADEIRAKIDKLKPGFGFSSAACGSDILFLEAMLHAGAEISIVLPYTEEEFVRDSVDIIPDSKWGARFERVLSRAARVITASTQRLEIGGVSYEFANQLLLGLASIRSRQLDTTLVPLAVWNGKPGDGPGGAASVVELWRKSGYEPKIVDLATVAAVYSSRRSSAKADDRRIKERRFPNRPGGWKTAAPCEAEPKFSSRIVAILFADAVGFSKLTEAEVPHFVEQFLGAIARLSEKFAEKIVARNTWGDGLYFVFSNVGIAGDFALQLADLASKTKWEEKGLRSGLNLRIALHAGPAYEFDDPITGNRSYSGTHVSRAARIEPITPPGQVYASEAFAALAAARRAKGFTCDYVGQTPMAKGYGTLPVYHVRRARAAGASL